MSSETGPTGALGPWLGEAVRSPGRWVQLLAAGHLAVGIVTYRRELAESFRRGVFDTVEDRGSLATAWWFLVAAPVTWSTGRAMCALEHGEAPAAPLASVGRTLAATGLVGAIVMPRSPFALLALAGARTISRARR